MLLSSAPHAGRGRQRSGKSPRLCGLSWACVGFSAELGGGKNPPSWADESAHHHNIKRSFVNSKEEACQADCCNMISHTDLRIIYCSSTRAVHVASISFQCYHGATVKNEVDLRLGNADGGLCSFFKYSVSSRRMDDSRMRTVCSLTSIHMVSAFLFESLLTQIL